ncbi:hypothetical protein GE061_003830 [Apolygus lucorum]|uniref:Gustatory receptor n=1 Tax=Apolygus lucorum TaxID=248454 RepID=A0A8S9X511_APOLU|nr:hypothetical protein GE061_003830 [Apolygus lucorum]
MPHHHLRFSTFLGIYPFTGSGQLSSKYVVYSLVVLVWFFYEVFAYNNSVFFQGSVQTIKVGWLIFGLVDLKRKLVVVMSFVHIFKLVLNRATVSEIHKLSGAPDDSLPFFLSFVFLAMKFVLEWVLYEFSDNSSRMLNSLIMFHLNLVKATMLLQFCGFLKNFRRQLDNLYAHMEKNKIVNVSALVDKHAQILTHMKLSNAIYSHQILAGCIIYGEFMIVNLLLLVMGFMGDKSILELVNSAFATSFYLVANEFNVELFQLMRNNNDLYCNDKLLLYVKMKQTVQFSACGFFALGFPFLTSIMAVVTTYLVILLQFSLPKQ